MFRPALALLVVSATIAQAQTDPSLWKSLKLRHIGPEGNRVTSVSGVVGDPMTFYAGAASGGIFKTSDGGVHFGYQIGGGIDFKLGPLRPFVEYRWIELDGPGDVNVKYYPLIFGVGIF